MRKITAIFLIKIIATICCLHAKEVKIVLADKILLEQEEEILLNPRSFIIMEDGIIVIPDSKVGDFKIYDHNGKFKKIWGKQGPGPNEFGRPFFCDYKKPYFAFVDYGKRKIYVVKRVDDFSFKKVKEHLCLSLSTDLKITKNNILVAGYIVDSNYKEFALYMLQIDKNRVYYLLPIERSYGFTSKTKYKNSYNKIAALGNIGYCSINDKYIYYVWIGDLRIIKKSLKTNRINYFGTKTERYKPLKATKSLLNAYQRKMWENYRRLIQESSRIHGIFSDSDLFGLIYGNFNEKESVWSMNLQIYSPEGQFLLEEPLNDAVNYSDFLNLFFYSKEDKHLYFLSRRLNENYLDEYEILKYKIIIK